jgi:hypothetical protein
MLSSPQRTVILDNGGLVKGTGRQDEIKAETLADAMAAMGVDAVNLTPSEAALGSAYVNSLQELSGGRFVATAPFAASAIPRWREVGPFLVGGLALPRGALAQAMRWEEESPTQAARALCREAKARKKQPLLLLRGSRDDARALALAAPDLRLIVYRNPGSPTDRLDTVGRTVIATPGDRGKWVLRLTWRSGRFVGIAPVDLGPTFEDDSRTASLYRLYLDRVREERLLEQVPRSPSEPFAGNERCGECHPSAMAVWSNARHRRALATLEREGHDRDPDCVSCHVVGLDRVGGFVSRTETPHLTDVGCESCHGPGKKHSESPNTVKMPKVGEKSCIPCHVPDHSPGFDFLTYWRRIQHQ